jgi:predicted phage terminase large subunit-like protein
LAVQASALSSPLPETALASELIAAINQFHDAAAVDEAKHNFLAFVRRVWPAFIEGPHHRIIGDVFDRVARGELKRVIINIPPRHGKSELASYHLPAFLLGQDPTRKIITATHTQEFSVRFGRKVRNLVNSTDFRKIFPGVKLAADSKASGRWDVSKGGEYFAVGVGGAVTGRGADLLIIDDPHSEAAGISPTVEYFDGIYEWYSSGPRQRLQPGGAIVVVMTRWHELDLTGQILRSAHDKGGADEWEVIELPALYDDGTPMWPEFWPIEELEALKRDLPLSKWEAQYQQRPTSEGLAIVKREWWNKWVGEKAPPVEFVIMSWDTAHTKNARSDYSACTVWGVFKHPGEDGVERPNLILLDAINEKLEFPELKKRALELYKSWKPDSFIVEAKAAGLPMIQELRAAGIPVMDFTPTKGQDKLTRVNAVSDIFASRVVWAPPTRWAEEVIEQCAGFPNAAHDDLVDATTMALMRYRRGGFIPLSGDWAPDDGPKPFKRQKEYY